MVRRCNNKLIGYLYNDFYILKSLNKFYISTDKKLQLTGQCSGGKAMESCKWNYANNYIEKSFDMMKKISPKLLKEFEKKGPNCYQIFGLDVILDKNKNLSLLEINYGPGFSDCNYKINIKMIRELINLVIMPEVNIECKVKTGWKKICELE